MNDPLEFIRKTRSVAIATVDEVDGDKPAVRIVDVMLHYTRLEYQRTTPF